MPTLGAFGWRAISCISSAVPLNIRIACAKFERHQTSWAYGDVRFACFFCHANALRLSSVPLMGRVVAGAHIVFGHNPREAYGALLTVLHPVCRPILCAFDSFVWQGWHL